MQRKGHHRDPAQGLPNHGILAEGVEPQPTAPGLRVRLDHRSARRHHQLHPRPAHFCVSIALAYRGVVQQAVVYDPTATTSSTPPKGAAPSWAERPPPARLQAHPHGRRPGRHRLPPGDNAKRYVKMFEGHGAVHRPAPPGAAALDLCYVPPATTTPSSRPAWPLGRRRRLADRDRSRWPDRQLHRRGRLPAPARVVARQPQDLRPAGADLAPYTRVIKETEAPAARP